LVHLVFRDRRGTLGEKLPGLRLEDLPGRIGDDGVKAAALEDVVKRNPPVKRAEAFDVGDGERTRDGFSFRSGFFVPGRPFKLDFQVG
jgi:hypothetical protein